MPNMLRLALGFRLGFGVKRLSLFGIPGVRHVRHSGVPHSGSYSVDLLYLYFF